MGDGSGWDGIGKDLVHTRKEGRWGSFRSGVWMFLGGGQFADMVFDTKEFLREDIAAAIYVWRG